MALVLGVNGHPMWSATDPRTWYTSWADVLQASGGRMLRYDLDFSSVNSQHANLLTVLAARSITPYVMFGRIASAPWAVPNATTYATAAGTLASSLPSGSYIEVWNEPNENNFWNNAPVAADYVTLANAAYTAIKNANANVKVAVGAVSYNNATYRQAILGGLTNFDAFAIHPYSQTRSPSDVSDTAHSFVQCIRDTITDMATSFSSKEIVISEFGWSMADTSATNDPLAALYYGEARNIVAEYPQVTALLAYHNGDRTGSGAETTTSMMDSSRHPSLSWLAHFDTQTQNERGQQSVLGF